MDRTNDFMDRVNAILPQTHRPRISASPFVLRAAEMLMQLTAMEKVVGKVYIDFVDYHKYLPYKKSNMTEIDRAELDKEIALFIATYISETHELKRNVSGSDPKDSSSFQHHMEVVNYLLERLSKLNKRIQIMKRERLKYAKKPFRLLSVPDSKATDLVPFSTEQVPSQTPSSTNALTASSETPLSKTASLPVKMKKDDISKTFAERYESDIAPPSKLKEYENLASKHRVALLKETKQLHEKFSADRQLAHRMEQTVSSISSMLDEFVRIVQSQSEHVTDMHDSSKLATKHVQQTGDELLLTIERSQSYRRNMVILTVSLALLLLILDYLTP